MIVDSWKGQSFNDIMKDVIFDFLDDQEGQSFYGADLASEITMSDNTDGAFVLYTENAKNFIKEFWDEANETYEDCVFNFGSDYAGKLNPFGNPEEYTFFMEDFGVRRIINEVEVINDNWNDEIELTPEMIDCIKKQINALPIFDKDREVAR